MAVGSVYVVIEHGTDLAATCGRSLQGARHRDKIAAYSTRHLALIFAIPYQ